jgi:uncharacterized membrane protein YfcA
MQIIGYVAAILMGFSLGLVGGGGSILTVPILVYFFLVDPIAATSASLFIVGSTALLGAILAFRRDEVDLKTGILFAGPSFVGVFVTKSFCVPKIPDVIYVYEKFVLTKSIFVMILFALLMLTASVAMFKNKKNISEEKFKNNFMGNNTKLLQTTLQGFFVGIVTGFVGAGGGFLIVPALINLVGLDIRKSIGTSLSIIAANSLFGFSVALYNGLIPNWSMLFLILSVALVGLVIGSIWSSKVSEKKLKTGFAYFVFSMGFLILLDQIRKI